MILLFLQAISHHILVTPYANMPPKKG